MKNLAKEIWRTVSWTAPPDNVSSRYASLPFKKGRYAKQVWLHDGIEPHSRAIGLGEVSVPANAHHERLSAWLATETITSGQYFRCLLASLPIPRIDDLREEYPDAIAGRLDVAITEIDPGSVISRLVLGLAWFGVGHAWVQIEAAVCEPQAKYPLMVAIDRRRYSQLLNVRDWFWPSRFNLSVATTLIQEVTTNILLEVATQFQPDQQL